MKQLQIAQAVAVVLCMLTLGIANAQNVQGREVPGSREKEANCQKLAAGLTGKPLQYYRSGCISPETTGRKGIAGKRLGAMRYCHLQAGAKKLEGEARKQYLDSCMKREAEQKTK
jgi:hypothetical protein